MKGIWSIGGETPNPSMDHYFLNGKNVADLLGGKLYIYDHNAVVGAGEAEYLHSLGAPEASQAEVSNVINADAPGNGAGKGSMKEGLLSAAAAAAGMYGAGQFMGGGNPFGALADKFSGATSAVKDALPTWMQPTAGGVADTGFGAGTVPGGYTPAEAMATNDLADMSMGQQMLGATGQTYPDFLKTLGPAASIGAAAAGVGGGGSGTTSSSGATGGGGSGVATGAAAGSALSRILSGTATASDWLSVAGGVGSTALGVLGSAQQTKSLESLAREQMAAEASRYEDAKKRADEATARQIEAQQFGRSVGQPSRDRYEASYAPGFTMEKDPGYTDAMAQASKATLHGLSVNGNPDGSPNAWAQTLKDLYDKTAYPALQQYRSNNATTGGYAGYNAAGASAPGYTASAFGNPNVAGDTSAAAIGANSNIFNSLGKGLANVTNPTQNLSLADLAKMFNGGGNNIFSYGQ